MKAAKEFLSTLFAQATEDLCIVSYSNVKAEKKKYPAQQLCTREWAAMEQFIKRYDVPGRAVYICVSSVPTGIRTKLAVGETFALHADLDFNNINAAEIDIKAAVARLQLRPTLVIFSGHGLHLWWLLKTPCKDKSRMEALQENTAKVLAADPHVCHVAAVMRVPDSHNTKHGENHLVEIKQRNATSFTIEELEEYFEHALPLLQYKEQPVQSTLVMKPSVSSMLEKIYHHATGEHLRSIDHATMWDDVRYYGDGCGGNLHDTILANTASLANFYPPDEVVERICDDIERVIPEASMLDWDWSDEIEFIQTEGICRLFAKDLNLYEKWKDDAPAWVTNNSMIKNAVASHEEEIKKQTKKLERAIAKGAANGNGALSPSPTSSGDDPVDLWETMQPRPLPRGILPKVIEDFAFAQARLKGCDPAGLAMGALCAAGAAIPDSIQIKVKVHDQWTESARLWVILVGGVSTQKTPIYNEITREVKKIDAALARQSGIETEQWEEADKNTRGPKPPQRRLVITDATVESVGELAQDNPDGLFMIRNEVSAWWGSMERYLNQKGGGDQPFWLEAYDGGSRTVDRIKRGNKRIENLGVSVVGGIQPDKIREHAAVASDDGLIQRAITVILANAGKDIDEPMPPEAQLFDKLIATLHDLPRQTFGALSFTPEAQAIRQTRADRDVECAKIFEDYNTKFSSHLGKYRGMFARLCLIFHCIEHQKKATASDIDEDIARRVDKFMSEFMLPHAATFYMNVLDGGKERDRVRAVAGYILSHKPVKPLTNRDVVKATRKMQGITKTEVDTVFYVLEAVGWLTRGKQVRSDSVPWIVNPRVYELFHERGELEKEKRQVAQEELREIFAKKGHDKNADQKYNRREKRH